MISFDTNVLVYATAALADDRVSRAQDPLARAMRALVMPALLQSHPATVLVDEFDAGRFEGIRTCDRGPPPRTAGLDSCHDATHRSRRMKPIPASRDGWPNSSCDGGTSRVDGQVSHIYIVDTNRSGPEHESRVSKVG
jgi:hypothetical protein